MSENPTAEELVRNVTFQLQRSNVIPTPVDPTLSNEGEAADAKATGDAIAGVISNLRVNEKAPTNNAITLYASDIKMSSDEGAETITAAIEAAGDRGADDIMYDEENLVSVKDALDEIYTTIDSELTESEIDDIVDAVFGGDE